MTIRAFKLTQVYGIRRLNTKSTAKKKHMAVHSMAPASSIRMSAKIFNFSPKMSVKGKRKSNRKHEQHRKRNTIPAHTRRQIESHVFVEPS